MHTTVGGNTDSRIESFHDALVGYDRIEARRIFLENETDDPLSRIEYLIVPALEQIGEGWAEGRLSLSQVYMSGKICEELVREGLHSPGGGRSGGSQIALAVYEDRHMLGKRIVYSVLSAHGYLIDDYGAVNSESLFRLIRQREPRVLFLSVLILPSALRLKEFMGELARLPHRPKVMVGGAPFRYDPELADSLGVDAYGITPQDAAAYLRKLGVTP